MLKLVSFSIILASWFCFANEMPAQDYVDFSGTPRMAPARHSQAPSFKIDFDERATASTEKDIYFRTPVEPQLRPNYEIVLPEGTEFVQDGDQIVPLNSSSANSQFSIHPVGSAPKLDTKEDQLSIRPGIAVKPVSFESGSFRHRQLLFEDPLLERHGLSRTHRPAVQPLLSGAQFLRQSAVFPFEMIKKSHRRCDSSLGWGTPGSRPLSSSGN